MKTAESRKTPLYDLHVEAGAKIVDFGGWLMPLWTSGLLEEHRAVRTSAGLFDVSHMGEVWLEGAGASRVLGSLVTADVLELRPGRAKYCALLNEEGGIVDDLLVYKLREERLLCVVNAGTREGDIEQIRRHLPAGCGIDLVDRTLETCLLALQGPRTREILFRAAGSELRMPFYGFVETVVAGVDCLVARTGYTGEWGYEIMAPWEAGPELWRALMDAGSDANLRPVGLGARDTLRLEAGMMLYGNDMDETTTPLEAGLEWIVSWDHEFVGREALLKQKREGCRRRLVGFEMVDRGIPRSGYRVQAPDGRWVGVVTSGTKSPTLGKAIGLAYVEPGLAEIGRVLGIEVRKTTRQARVVELPFYRRPRRRPGKVASRGAGSLGTEAS